MREAYDELRAQHASIASAEKKVMEANYDALLAKYDNETREHKVELQKLGEKLSAEQAVDKERLITSQDAVHKQQLSTLKDTVEHLKERVAAYEKAIKEAEERANRMVEDHQRQLTAVTKDAEARMQEVVAAIKSEYSALIETERSVSEGRIQALRQQHETDLATSKASTSAQRVNIGGCNI